LELAQAVLMGVGAAVQDSTSFRGFLPRSTGTSSTSSSTSASSRPYAASALSPGTWLGVPEQVQLSMYAPSGSFYTAHKDCAPDSTLWALGLLAWLRGRAYRRRYITAILYLNDEEEADEEKGGDSGGSGSGTSGRGTWLPSDGGCLRLHLRPAQGDGRRVSDDTACHGDRSREGDGGEGERLVLGSTGAPAAPAIQTDHTAHCRHLDIRPCGGRLVLLDSRTVLHEVLPTRRRRVALSTFMTLNRA
jgi:hypothetical protein